ncbi:RING-type E3 ubiquitin transferase [Sarracenia purpurea var. burkii]
MGGYELPIEFILNSGRRIPTECASVAAAGVCELRSKLTSISGLNLTGANMNNRQTTMSLRHRLLLNRERTAPPAGGSRSRGFYTGEVNFNSNTMIILPALLCALVCVQGLNSIVAKQYQH